MALFAVACRVADGARAVLYWIQFMDKTTLGSAAILGIRCASGDYHLLWQADSWLYLQDLGAPDD